ncbi:riboflavin synthase eubacterial/eukaryotic [Klebsiella pneumoniae]|uniref:Riboflavin synthase n=1 Tax=Klebsiella pneumoniae TaxID=573 RepID=A0A2X1RJW7_KLEPN|nr:riboflavin synthase eubacterial/eukaryotic [Klebsiella pneumoniae]
MSGHIMTTAEIVKILTSENNRQIWFRVQDPTLMKYILYKGFIGIDGISLTVGEVTATPFLRTSYSGDAAADHPGSEKTGRSRQY